MNPNERWRPVHGFDGYEVSSDGRVRRNGRVIRPEAHVQGHGYLRVRMAMQTGAPIWRRVHVLVLHAFVGPRPSLLHVGAHGYGGRLDNRLANLSWALPSDNEHDKKRLGTHTGGKIGKKTSPPALVQTIRELRTRGLTFSEIARSYGLHRSSVSRIVRGLRRRAA